MTRFTRLQYWQLLVFCLYWFVFFPLIWFLCKPVYFASSILKTILFALLLLIIYYIIYLVINKCCCQEDKTSANKKGFRSKPTPRRGGADNPVYAPTTTSKNEDESRVSMPDSVIYENMPRIHKPGLVCHEEPLLDEENKNVRFITSCSLYYDGHDFHDT